MTTATAESTATGRVVRVIGPVVDVGVEAVGLAHGVLVLGAGLVDRKSVV